MIRTIVYNVVSHELPTVAEKVKGDSQILCPVKDGILRSSIKIQSIQKEKVVIGSNLDYAKFPELGTRNMINAHGPHDPKNPVSDWTAKRKRNDTGPSVLPFLQTAAYNNLYWIAEYLGHRIKFELESARTIGWFMKQM